MNGSPSPSLTHLNNNAIDLFLAPTSVIGASFGGSMIGAAFGIITGLLKGGIIKKQMIVSSIIFASTFFVYETLRENVLNNAKTNLKEKCKLINAYQLIIYSIAIFALKRFVLISNSFAAITGALVLFGFIGTHLTIHNMTFNETPAVD